MERNRLNVLVTGGAGFIGTNLIRRLIEGGHTVYSIDNYSTGKRENRVKGCTYFTNDINQLKKYNDEFISKIDVVYHLAAQARIQPSFKDPDPYFDTNINGTKEVVKFCLKHKAPLIYAGSSSHHSGKFKNPYTFTKDIGEEIIYLYQRHFGLKATVARFYNVYGPNQLLEGEYTTLIGRWLYNIENNIPCEIYGDGEKRRDFTHVSDIVDALIKIKEKEAWGHTFELGRGHSYSINEVAEMFGITPIYKPNKEGEAEKTLCSSEKEMKMLGWYPKIDLLSYINEYKSNLHSNIR